MSKRYKVENCPHICPPGMSVAIYRDPEWEEYQVDILTFGKPALRARYHTNCLEDARDTAKAMAENAMTHHRNLSYGSY